MAGSDWTRVKEILGEAFEHPPDERSVFLDEACGSDEALRDRVQELLSADAKAEGFLPDRATL